MQGPEREGHDFSRAVEASTQSGALAPEGGSYIELVVSSSKTLIDKSRAEIVDLALSEVREFFPAAREANLLKSTVIKEVNATYSPRPGIDAHRPAAATAWPRVFLAGDWTATGWPATMEGAVRSGYLAAEALARAAGLKVRASSLPTCPRPASCACSPEPVWVRVGACPERGRGNPDKPSKARLPRGHGTDPC